MTEKRKMLRYDEADVYRELLYKLQWRSVDKDNMEFETRITYSQMDDILEALKGNYPDGW